jgi:hypothetical protein
MDKSQALESIEKARQAHLNQMDKIKLAMEGKKIEQPTALSKTQCDVGRWIYSDTQKLQKLLGIQFYNELESTHETWHREYARIYEILFSEKKEKGLFSKIFASSKIDPLELDKVKLYYEELNETTNKLLKILDKSHRRLEALSESKFL